jgi:glyoxylase-like metal-dependent hydrolase (beta-lactamase superfamily II)
MNIQSWTVGPFAENPYLLACAETGQAVFVDPGDDAPRLIAAIKAAGVRLQAILLTHAHLDHVAALTEMREATGAPVYLHPADNRLLAQAPAYWAAFDRRIDPIHPADHPLAHGERVTFGKCELIVLHTPGHTPGSVCFHAPADQKLIAGDTLFLRSVGRTDLPGGDMPTLIEAIRTRLWVLPDETEVYPGHGQTTSIGVERRHNPFVGMGQRKA